MSKIFDVNNFLSLKLEDRKTIIFINGKKFIQCKYLLIDIPFHQVDGIFESFSIDNHVDDENELDYHNYGSDLDPELEFWGHCSNLQVWYEYNYDTRLLHRNLAFPLLKKLAEVGDPLAKRVFKEELTHRLINGNRNVVAYLLEEGYLQEFDQEELQTILENINVSQLVNKNFDLIFLLLNKLDIRSIDRISEISWFKDLESVKELNIESRRLTNLNGLKNFANLESINLNENELTKIQGLDAFIKLKKLNLNRNKIVSMKGLENLEELEELYLWNNQIEEITGLENLKKLKKLSLGGNQIREIKGLENLKNLVFLDLSYNQIKELKGLSNLINLQVLYLQSNKLTQVNEINKLPKLREIKINNNLIPKRLLEHLRSSNLIIMD